MKYMFALVFLFLIFAVNYYAEVNREILLFGVYPACLLSFLLFVAYYEKR